MRDEKAAAEEELTVEGQAPDDGGASGGLLDPQALGTADEAATVEETGPGAGGD